MKLEDIGFYTLTDERAANVTADSPLHRCELLLTDACNFKCPYCRGMRDDCKGSLSAPSAWGTVDLWCQWGLKNIRFSGGEPTLYPGLPELVEQAKRGGIERIALSTNGSADIGLYRALIDRGVNDISISLDACCAGVGDKMAGRGGVWKRVARNIGELARMAYVTVGVVFTDDTKDTINDVILFAHNLGVADIRIISAAQFNECADLDTPKYILDAHPILKYRVTNYRQGNAVRGIGHTDNHRCPLALDDMASAGGYHFPCIIYLREQGNPIGLMGPAAREQRAEWAANHNTYEDPICRNNCLDVCVDYNNRVRDLNRKVA